MGALTPFARGVGFDCPFTLVLKSASIFAGKVLLRSQMVIMLSSLDFCSAGRPFMMSSNNAGMSSVTRLTAAGYVPGSPLPSRFRSWPAAFAFSIHWRTTLSITYNAPSLWVAGAFFSAR